MREPTPDSEGGGQVRTRTGQGAPEGGWLSAPRLARPTEKAGPPLPRRAAGSLGTGPRLGDENANLQLAGSAEQPGETKQPGSSHLGAGQLTPRSRQLSKPARGRAARRVSARGGRGGSKLTARTGPGQGGPVGRPAPAPPRSPGNDRGPGHSGRRPCPSRTLRREHVGTARASPATRDAPDLQLEPRRRPRGHRAPPRGVLTRSRAPRPPLPAPSHGSWLRPPAQGQSQGWVPLHCRPTMHDFGPSSHLTHL